MLLCFRWPLLGVPHQLNPDESQLIAGAITLRHDPVFWRAVDGGTAGPLDFYPLLPAAWVEGMASYAVARLIGLAVVFGAVVFAGEALALLAGAALARIAVLPAIAAIAFTTYPDFVHYSTELDADPGAGRGRLAGGPVGGPAGDGPALARSRSCSARWRGRNCRPRRSRRGCG